jgi:hypothetical protein
MEAEKFGVTGITSIALKAEKPIVLRNWEEKGS